VAAAVAVVVMVVIREEAARTTVAVWSAEQPGDHRGNCRTPDPFP